MSKKVNTRAIVLEYATKHNFEERAVYGKFDDILKLLQLDKEDYRSESNEITFDEELLPFFNSFLEKINEPYLKACRSPKLFNKISRLKYFDEIEDFYEDMGHLLEKVHDDNTRFEFQTRLRLCLFIEYRRAYKRSWDSLMKVLNTIRRLGFGPKEQEYILLSEMLEKHNKKLCKKYSITD